MGNVCTANGKALGVGSKFATSPVTPRQAALIQDNYKAMSKHIFEIGLMCYERLIDNIPEAVGVLKMVERNATNRNEIMNQGQIFLKGVATFIMMADDRMKMQEAALRLTRSHAERFGLTAEKMARSLFAIQEIFIQEAMAHCTHDEDETQAAWKKFFFEVCNIFVSLSRRNSKLTG